MTKLIVNVQTGDIVEREPNKTEKDQQKLDETVIAAEQAKDQAKATTRQAILDRLGLTAEEAQLLLGGN
jgi:hypothetical protein